jgi:phasin family protein
MNENLIANMKPNLQPMIDVAEITHSMWEKLAELQSEYLTNCSKASMEQLQALAASKDPTEVIELQFKFAQDFGRQVTDTAEQKMTTMTEVRDAITKVGEVHYEKVRVMDLFTEALKIFTAETVEADKPAKPA